jgi:hypothetical protein
MSYNSQILKKSQHLAMFLHTIFQWKEQNATDVIAKYLHEYTYDALKNSINMWLDKN